MKDDGNFPKLPCATRRTNIPQARDVEEFCRLLHEWAGTREIALANAGKLS